MGALKTRSLLGLFGIQKLITPERVWSYPLVAFVVLACVALYDRLAGEGLANGISGAFGGDFLSFYTGGHFVRSGMPGALSDPDAQLLFQRQLLGYPVESVALWVSPPYLAWAFVPLAHMPYVLAYGTFCAASILCLWLAWRILGRELLLPIAPRRMLWIAVQYYPTMQWLLNGQTTGVWLCVFVGVFVLLRRGQDVPAGLLLGALCCKPQLALGIGVVLLVARRFRTLAAAALSTTAFVILGFATLPEAMFAYLKRGSELVALVRARGYNTAALHGSFEFATLLLDGLSPRLASVVGSALTVLVLAVIARLWQSRPWEPATAAWDLRMAAALALGVIASPHLFAYDLMLLLLPLFIVVAHKPARHGLPLGAQPLLGLTAGVWALGLLGPALSAAQQAVSSRLLGFPMALQIGVIAILLWAMAVARMADRASSVHTCAADELQHEQKA